MSNMDCIKKAALESRDRLTSGRAKLTKMIKPVLRLLSKSRSKRNAITPATCNYDVVESEQNEANEGELFKLHFEFYGRREEECARENDENEELERRLKESADAEDLTRVGVQRLVNGQVVVERIERCGTYLAVPVHFVPGPDGAFAWSPLPDGDVRRRIDDSPICGHQVPEQQVPVMCVTSAA